jgi:nucleotide-binding universal stress UspA family protein
MTGTIVVGIDDAASCPALLEWTAKFASENGAEVLLVNAVPRADVWVTSALQANPDNYVAERRQSLQRDVVAPLRAKGVDARLHVEIGNPADVLLASARAHNARSVVVGAPRHRHRHLVPHDAVVGSVLHHLERNTDRPLIVVPEAADLRDERDQVTTA